MKEPTNSMELCEEVCHHTDIVNSVRSQMPDEETLYELADLFKLFSDSTRIKILQALSQSEMCVCDIAELISMSQSAVSHQLRVLKQGRLIKARREGKQIFYSLDDSHVTTIMQQGLTHIEE